MFFFFKDPPTTEISTLSLPDALPISAVPVSAAPPASTETAAYAESVTAGGDGTERYLSVLATRTGDGNAAVRVDGFTAGPVRCDDGSLVFGFKIGRAHV